MIGWFSNNDQRANADEDRECLTATVAPGRLLLNWQRRNAGFPLTVIRVEERARYLEALDQGHAGQLLDLQTLVTGAVKRE